MYKYLFLLLFFLPISLFASVQTIQGSYNTVTPFVDKAGWAFRNTQDKKYLAVRVQNTASCSRVSAYTHFYEQISNGQYDTMRALSIYDGLFQDFSYYKATPIFVGFTGSFCVFDFSSLVIPSWASVNNPVSNIVLLTQNQATTYGTSVITNFPTSSTPASLLGTYLLNGTTLSNFLISPNNATLFQQVNGYYPYTTTDTVIPYTGSWYFSSTYNSWYYGFPNISDTQGFVTNYASNTNTVVPCTSLLTFGQTCSVSQTNFLPAVYFFDNISDIATIASYLPTSSTPASFSLSLGSSSLSYVFPVTIPDTASCDISQVSFSLSSFISWGSFSVLGCSLSVSKFILFGFDGFSFQPFEQFYNSVKNTLPFQAFSLATSVFYYIEPNGHRVNLPASLPIYHLPLGSASFDLDLHAFSSFVLPHEYDHVLSLGIYFVTVMTWAVVLFTILI